MNKRTSEFLDVLRAVAALLVVVSHLSAPVLSGNVLTRSPLMNLGHEAVMVFFVLSGYLIAWVGRGRESVLEEFALSRLSRLYSVIIPALAIVPLLDAIGRSFEPTLYQQISASDVWPVRVFAHTFFLQTLWFLDVRYFSDGPMWSVGYEFWYYALFGVYAFVPRRWPYKWPIFVAMLLLIGPKIASYGIVWLFGAICCHLHRRDARLRSWLATLVFCTSLASLFVLGQVRSYMQSPGPFGTIFYDLLIGLSITISIYVLRYSHPALVFRSATLSYLASISFTLYLFHYPLIYFFFSVLHLSEIEPAWRLVVLALLLFPSIHFLSWIFEQRRGDVRTFLRWSVTRIPSVRLRALNGHQS